MPTELKLTNLDKIFWPEEGYTKGDLIEYYQQIAPIILPYLKDRPESLNRFPNGIEGSSFFQKNMIPPQPSWLKLMTIDDTQYMEIQDERHLLYAVNLGCIELNPFLSRQKSILQPDYMVIDLDPQGQPFHKVTEIAQAFHQLLDVIKAPNYCKTSGSRGLHICVPLAAKYSYEQSKTFAELLCQIVHERLPDLTSMERKPSKRTTKIYLDYLQNRKHQTLASPYCVRPKPHAPVSTPLHWDEVNKSLKPTDWTIKTIFKRIEEVGDLWKPVIGKGINLQSCLKHLEE
jgi:bifunctional non-homologous end joining protein LigD